MPRESHGQRSLAGYTPWGGAESDMTETAKAAAAAAFFHLGFPSGSVVKNLPEMLETSILAWRIPWTEEPHGL